MSINDFFDPKYVDTTPIPKQENHPDELKQKVKKTILESGMLEHAKNYEKTPIVKTIPSLVKLFGDLIKDDEYLQHGLKNLKFLAENEDYWTLKNSQIIEHTVKAIFKLFMQLDLAIKGAEEKYIRKLLKVSNTFGRIIQYFDPDFKLLEKK